jgi:hypothetical protein
MSRSSRSSLRLGLGSCCVVLGFASLLWCAAAAAETPGPPTYRCQGFDEPLHDGMNIPQGRVLPLRGKLVAADGSFADQRALKTPPAVSLKFQPASGPEVDKTATIEVRDYGKGNRFVWDDEAHWKFDLGTKSLESSGKYSVRLVSGDEAEYKVDPACALTFNLKGGEKGGE